MKNHRLEKFSLFAYLFGFRQLVSRSGYAMTGFSLMLVKYMTEALLIRATSGKTFTPLDFLNPLLVYRQQFFEPPAPPWLMIFALVWSFPFLWILVSMTIRRAWHAGWHGGAAFMVLIPGFNIVTMLVLCLVPGKRSGVIKYPDEPGMDNLVPDDAAHFWRSAFTGVTVGICLSLVAIWFSVYVLKEYGSMLFFGVPILVGFVTTILFNFPHLRGFKSSLLMTWLTILGSGMVIVAFAMEGIVCVGMLLPLATGLAALGSMVGYAICATGQNATRAMAIAAVLLPGLSGVDAFRTRDQLFEVKTAVEIDAAADVVWKHVISFSEIDSGPSWLFRLGLAMPLRATIEGTGVGAVRYCEFTTGPFVEPVTAWEPGVRLAFDVASQPPPMSELSPYRHVHPPHLDHYLRSRRGEFRLIDLGQGRTRLEGSTWYELDIHPQDYWLIWSDWCIHRIHRRVLSHIRDLSEGRSRK
jgi:hypothetical protein